MRTKQRKANVPDQPALFEVPKAPSTLSLLDGIAPPGLDHALHLRHMREDRLKRSKQA
jgi:hypothetical protein